MLNGNQSGGPDNTGRPFNKQAQQGASGGLGEVRHMPESLAAEAAVLGSMIIDPVCIGETVERIKRESFYRVEHQIIYEVLVDLYQNHPL